MAVSTWKLNSDMPSLTLRYMLTHAIPPGTAPTKWAIEARPGKSVQSPFGSNTPSPCTRGAS
eukprot:2550964-Pyramimonas_sp.AAC.1